MYDRKETLFYVDPPYVMSTRSKSTVLYSNELNDADHVALSQRLHDLHGMVVLSGYSSTLYDDLYSDWRKVSKKSTAQNGKGRVECLWISPNIQPMFFELT
jgi:DNA adenine methylase